MEATEILEWLTRVLYRKRRNGQQLTNEYVIAGFSLESPF